MTRKFIFLSLILMSSLLALAQPTITVAVASNMQYAMQELVAAYNQTNKTKIDIMMGASGNLTQQIMNGAPVDIFISADTVFPQKLAEHKLALTPPRVYARGVLVLWTVKPDIHPSKDLNLLLSNTIQTIAIANPGIAPYGNASLYLLKKRGLYDKVSSKLVVGESITQTTQFIVTGNADIGFTAKSMVMARTTNIGNWVELDINEYPPIEQAAVLLNYAQQHNNEEAARKFYAFLYSATAKSIFKKLGYIIE